MANLEQQVARIRAIEMEISRRYPEQKMRQPVHLSIGQEAAAVGVCAALANKDLMVGSHRSHAWYLAKGGSLNALIAELYGKATGCSRGHGGSMHLCDHSVGFTGSTSIVGGTIPIGVGLAFAKKLKGENGCVVVCFGEAALEQGVFHEAANFAALHKLKVLFVCENNGLSCYTPLSERQPKRAIKLIADAHNLRHWSVQRDEGPDKIQHYTKYLLDRLPALLEIKCTRLVEHCGPALEHDVPELAVGPEVQLEIETAFQLAESAPWPDKAVGMYAT